MTRSDLQDAFGAVNRKVGGSAVFCIQNAAKQHSVSHRIIHHGRETLENKGNFGIQAKPSKLHVRQHLAGENAIAFASLCVPNKAVTRASAKTKLGLPFP